MKIYKNLLWSLALSIGLLTGCNGDNEGSEIETIQEQEETPTGPVFKNANAVVNGYDEVVLEATFDTRLMDGSISNALYLISPYNLTEQMFVFDNIGEANIRFSQAMDILPTAPGNYLGSLSGTDRCPNLNRFSGHTYYFRACIILDNGEEHYSEIGSYFIPAKAGDGPAGGIVFYDKGSYSDGWRFLEVAPFNLTRLTSNYDDFGKHHWSLSAKDIPGADSQSDGLSNTQDILANCNDCIAAQLCDEFSYGGYDDWYLPSIQELGFLQNTFQAGASLPGCNYDLFSNITLWSSTEVDAYKASYKTFGGGSILISKHQGYKIYVRPIRRY